MKGGLLRAAVATVPRLRDRREKARPPTRLRGFRRGSLSVAATFTRVLASNAFEVDYSSYFSQRVYESISFFRRYSIGWAVR
jgi:hypothetical protein